ncbi:MAG: TIGR02186 family protein [Alphaproteobacteria bacterium]|nr:MAG: TIGR02186 family protein [Alphaproteobacteria bacterium]
MRWRAALAALLLTAAPAAAQVAASEDLPTTREALNIGISSTEIAIVPDFAGTDVTVFGAIENVDPALLAKGGYDIVVALVGPRDRITMRRKERVAGIWINRHSVVFEAMPESYSMTSTRPLDRIASDMELTTHSVGLPRARIVPSSFSGRAEEVAIYRDAFLKLKTGASLYQENPSGVKFVSSSLFAATIHIPADVPNGAHTIRAYLFKEGRFFDEKQLEMKVVKTGLEEAITAAAFDQPLLYGLFAVLLAVLTGWAASLMFRRD